MECFVNVYDNQTETPELLTTNVHCSKCFQLNITTPQYILKTFLITNP